MDAAVCPECLQEPFTPGDRRYRYAFINCTQCGPRYTITERLPYDRPNTSMRTFALRVVRRRVSRSFYSAVSCAAERLPHCGPRLALMSRDRLPIDEGDVIAAAVARLTLARYSRSKGSGGYHLVCDAQCRRRCAYAVAQVA